MLWRQSEMLTFLKTVCARMNNVDGNKRSNKRLNNVDGNKRSNKRLNNVDGNKRSNKRYFKVVFSIRSQAILN